MTYGVGLFLEPVIVRLRELSSVIACTELKATLIPTLLDDQTPASGLFSEALKDKAVEK